jgi:hypothetical protein
MDLFNEYTALAALAVVAVQQILKLNVIPVYFANRFPIITNILLSIVAAIVVNWKTVVTLTTWTDWVVQVAVIGVVAAITYNSTLRNSADAQALTDQKLPVS